MRFPVSLTNKFSTYDRSKKIVFSGIQPTGKLHLGRYFGAIENWVQLQAAYDSIYCIVDYHAMTMPYNPDKLRENAWDLAINLLACGVEANRLFIQSMVPEHTELQWILGCMCSYGELSRMTQFKDKTQQVKEKIKMILYLLVYLYIQFYKQQIFLFIMQIMCRSEKIKNNI